MAKFIKIENKNIDIKKRDLVFAQYKRFFGEIPEHLELLGNVDPDILSDFMKWNMRLMRNKKFHPDLLTFIRVHIATIKHYEYCKEFNTRFLLQKGYDQDLIDTLDKVHNFPLANEQKVIAEKAMKAIYHSNEFNENDLQELYKLGWEITEIYDVIEHIGVFEKNSRFIKAFMLKK